MANCKNCGVEVADELELCSDCSATVAAPSKQLNTNMLVWSIVITAVSYLFGITLLVSWAGIAMGVLGIVFTILAKNASTAEVELQRLKLANTFIRVGKILAIISVALVALVIILYIAYIALCVFLGFGMGFLGALAG